MNYKFSRHAQIEMERRNISVDLVESVLGSPQQVIPEKDDRKSLSVKSELGRWQSFLIARYCSR